MSATLLSLLGFLSWTLALLLLMEGIRTKLVLTGEVPANGFSPDNAGQSAFMQRLARAHSNCLEGLPLFGGFMVLAVVAGKSQVTDPLAYAFLAARIVQSVIHLSSVSPAAVTFRFTAFAVQMGIAAYWTFRLYAG
ncbi:MAG TPA: MAPEG family protein [Burkholderiales bacterium]